MQYFLKAEVCFKCFLKNVGKFLHEHATIKFDLPDLSEYKRDDDYDEEGDDEIDHDETEDADGVHRDETVHNARAHEEL